MALGSTELGAVVERPARPVAAEGKGAAGIKINPRRLSNSSRRTMVPP
jgi:hypothetical protein